MRFTAVYRRFPDSIAVKTPPLCRSVPRYATYLDLSPRFFEGLPDASNLRVGGSNPSRRATFIELKCLCEFRDQPGSPNPKGVWNLAWDWPGIQSSRFVEKHLRWTRHLDARLPAQSTGCFPEGRGEAHQDRVR